MKIYEYWITDREQVLEKIEAPDLKSAIAKSVTLDGRAVVKTLRAYCAIIIALQYVRGYGTGFAFGVTWR